MSSSIDAALGRSLPQSAWRSIAVPSIGVARTTHRRLNIGRLIGMTGVIALALWAIFYPIIDTTDINSVDYAVGSVQPNLDHLFGTDLAGRDLFLRCAHALRVTMVVAVLGGFGAVAIGTLVGAISALKGGRTDRLFMRLVDAVNSVPHLLLGIIVAASLRGSLTAIIGVLAFTHWTQTARMVRAEIITLKSRDFITVAINQGYSRTQIMRIHMLPHVIGQLCISFVLLVPHAVWHESTLTFLGLGVPPHVPSLGSLLELSQQSLLQGNWWTLAAPAGVLIALTLFISLIAKERGGHH